MTIRVLTFTTILSLTLGAMAQQEKPQNKKPLSPAEAKEMMLKRTGGHVSQPATGATIQILNTQSLVELDAIKAVADSITEVLGIPFTYATGDAKKPIKAAMESLSAKENGAVMIFVSDKDAPTLLLAPEAPWVQINLLPLTKDADKEKLKMRLQKEIWRGFAFLMGAANSGSEHCAMQPVFSIQDLDNLTVQVVSPEPFNGILKQAKKLGIGTARKATYRQAVTEGWAPKPADKYQQAIWDELKK